MGASEQIMLSSDEVEEEVPVEETFQKVTLEFIQVNKFKARQKVIRIYDDKFLGIIEQRGKKQLNYWLDMRYLNPMVRKSIILGWKLGLFAVICLLLGVMIFTSQEALQELLKPNVAKLAGGVFLAFGALLLYFAVQNSELSAEIVSEHGKTPLASVFLNIPNKKTFTQFSDVLAQRIANAQKRIRQHDHSMILAAELKEHRRLRDAGVLTEKAYNTAKNKIMGIHE